MLPRFNNASNNHLANVVGLNCGNISQCSYAIWWLNFSGTKGPWPREERDALACSHLETALRVPLQKSCRQRENIARRRFGAWMQKPEKRSIFVSSQMRKTVLWENGKLFHMRVVFCTISPWWQSEDWTQAVSKIQTEERVQLKGISIGMLASVGYLRGPVTQDYFFQIKTSRVQQWKRQQRKMYIPLNVNWVCVISGFNLNK